MVQFWLLSYPRQNLEISLAKMLLGGRSRDNYRRVYQQVLSEGDLVVLHVTGEGKIKGFCRVAGDYMYDDSRVWPVVDGEMYPHRRPIEIIKVYSRAQEPDISNFYSKLDLLEEARKDGANLGSRFGLFLKGITPKVITQHDYDTLFDEDSKVITAEEEREEQVYALSVERDLELYLVNNLEHLEPGLKPYKNTEEARQLHTDVGRLDILAIDRFSNFVVIELKAGEADRDTIGQIIPYISWVKTNIAHGQEVRGIIVANSFDYRVIQSLDVLPFLGLIRYKVDFKFEEPN
jgi:hypothetical protein